MRLLHIKESFSDSGSPHDNAVIESLFKYLKRDTYNVLYYDTKEELEINLADCIDIHNNLRPHSYLNSLTPSEFELEYYINQKKPTDL